MNETLDGDYQTFKANDGAYVREHFFGRDPRTKAMVKDWTDDESGHCVAVARLPQGLRRLQAGR